VIRIDPDQHRIGLSLRKVDSAAFADKDFKLLAAEYTAEEEEPETPETSAPSPSDESSGDAPPENPEA